MKISLARYPNARFPTGQLLCAWLCGCLMLVLLLSAHLKTYNGTYTYKYIHTYSVANLCVIYSQFDFKVKLVSFYFPLALIAASQKIFNLRQRSRFRLNFATKRYLSRGIVHVATLNKLSYFRKLQKYATLSFEWVQALLFRQNRK